MAYKFKGSDIVTPFTVASNQPMFETTSISLQTQRASQNAQRWELSFTTVNTTDTLGDMLVGLIDNLDQADSMTTPQMVPSLIVGTPTVGAMSQGDSSFSANNPGDISGNWVKGMLFNFANQAKTYMVTNDVVATGTVTFFPSLVSDVPLNAAVRAGDNAIFTYVRSLDTATGITFTDGILSSPGPITLIEAL